MALAVFIAAGITDVLDGAAFNLDVKLTYTDENFCDVTFGTADVLAEVGDTVLVTGTVTLTNNLPAAAGELTLHNHGNHSTTENDGQPDEFLAAPNGGSVTYTYTGTEAGGNERGAFQWYHDHRMDVTGRNVWMGLAGMYIIDDPAEYYDYALAFLIKYQCLDDADKIACVLLINICKTHKNFHWLTIPGMECQCFAKFFDCSLIV